MQKLINTKCEISVECYQSYFLNQKHHQNEKCLEFSLIQKMTMFETFQYMIKNYFKNL